MPALIAVALIIAGSGVAGGTLERIIERRRTIDLRSSIAGHTAPVHTRLRLRG